LIESVISDYQRMQLKELHRSGSNLDRERPRQCPLWVISDICSAKGHVRFALNSDRESGFPQKVMSALTPKADMCAATTDVGYGPIADIDRLRPHG
jgi:hypothetical protein